MNIEQTKACSRCNQIKPFSEFYSDPQYKDGKRSDCKACHKARGKRYQDQTPAVRERKREWARNNRAIVSECTRKWVERKRNSPEEVAKREQRAIELSQMRAHAQNVEQAISISLSLFKAAFKPKLTREEALAQKRARNNTAWRNKFATDPEFRIHANMRTQIRKGMKGEKKYARTESYIGCTWAQLREWLEKQFIGCMSWDNYGTAWHIDHKVPRSYHINMHADEAEVRRCWHYTNLRPLWAKRNIREQDDRGAVQPELMLPMA